MATERRVGLPPLKCRRLARGQTQRDVARATGLTVDALKHWEIGRVRPPPAAERKLAAHFGVTIRELRMYPDLAPGRPRPEDIAPFLDKLAELVAKRVLRKLSTTKELNK